MRFRPFYPEKLSSRRLVAACLALFVVQTQLPLAAIASQPNSLPNPPQQLLDKQAKNSLIASAVRTNAKKLTIIKPQFNLSANPSDEELENAHLFPEPLIPMEGKSETGENSLLTTTLRSFKQTNKTNDVTVLSDFVKTHPGSRWTSALELNIASLCFHTGHLSESLRLWKKIWEDCKNQKGAKQMAIANRAVAEYLLVSARLGRTDEVKILLAEVAHRPFFGSDTEKVNGAKQGLGQMEAAPERAYKCGPYAVGSILELKPHAKTDAVTLSCSTKDGTNLVQVRELAKQVGLNYQMAKRSSGAAVIVPSVMHWKENHFAAIVEKRGSAYILKDPTFDNDGILGLTSETLDQESDGYFLVPAGSLPSGWMVVSDEEGAKVWGKGGAHLWNTGPFGPPGPCGAQCCTGGMAQASFRENLAALFIVDTPLSYQPPVGPEVSFKLDYEQILPNQPSTFNFTNFGPNWRFNWLSYMTVDAMTSTAIVRTPSSGSETFVLSGGAYPPAVMTQAVLVNLGGGVYQRKLPDGSMQVYDQPDGAGNIFMTKMVDPQGNTSTVQYDANYRISTITDPIGQVSTLNYLSNSVGNAGFYKVASITDAFGRSTSFIYDASTVNLAKITDSIGLQSQFNYDSNSTFITAMTTPYGTTSFQQYVPFVDPLSAGLRTTYPDGSFSVVENKIMYDRLTYYWDREATARYPADPANRDYTHCRTMRFLFDSNLLESPVKQWEKNPLESAYTYYTYPDQFDVLREGSINKPITSAREIGQQVDVVTISGTMTPGDYVRAGIFFASADYIIVAGDTPNSVASNLANLLNSSPNFVAKGGFAAATGNQIFLSTSGDRNTVFLGEASGAETVTIRSTQRQAVSVAVGGTVTAGNTLTLVVGKPFSQYEVINYSVVGSDTPTTIAAALAAGVNANTNLQNLGISAVSTGSNFTILSFSPAQQTISLSVNGGTETLTQTNFTNGANVNQLYSYNSLGRMTQSTDSMGRTFSYQYAANNIDLTQIKETQHGDNFLIGAWTYNSQHRPLTYKDGSGQITQYEYNSLGQLTKITDANSNITTLTYKGTTAATIGGTKTTGNVLTITVFDAGLSGGQKSINYTVASGDTLSSIATNFAAAITADTSLQTIGVSASAAGTMITLSSNSTNVTTYSQSVSGGSTETITLGANRYGYLSKIDGPLAGNKDVTSFAYDTVGRLASTTDSEGYTVSYSYDNADRLTQTTYPDGTSEQIVYDRLDSVFQKDRIGRWTQDSYDQMQQLAYEIDPLGRKTSYTWCICGSLAALTDGNAHTTRWKRDLQGRVIQKLYADGTAVDYVFDTFVSRLRSRTDAMNQKTVYTFNPDDSPIQVGYLNAVNPTGAVTYDWDYKFKRLVSVAKSDWGKYSYTYNNYNTPAGTAITGGGMLQLVHNDVIPNSDVTYQYDSLGRTTNRSINGASNSVSWAYDAMSRITNETNALGSFGYNYVDDTSGSSRGTTRLSSINYPNGQQTAFDWYANTGDQRLKQIANYKTAGGAVLSQFNYGYDSAGQITQWQQQQAGNNIFYNLGYDRAGQLTSAVAGSGAPQSPPANEYFYSYDSGANRTSVQSSNQQTIRVSGTKTTGNVLTITVKDAALTGGQEAISYTVLAADTLATIAQGLAAAINKNTNLQNLGVSANAHGTQTYINIRSASNNITTYATSTSGGATATLTPGIFKNGITNLSLAGTKTTGDVLTLTVKDAALSGGQKALSYTVLAGDTLATIATAIKNAINADSSLAALAVTATAVGTNNLSIASTSINATSFSSSTSSSATEMLSLQTNSNPITLAVLGGTKTTGDVLTLTVYDTALSGGKQSVSYTVAAGDTLQTIASGLAAAVNASTQLQNIAVSATASGLAATITSNSVNQTSIVQSYSSGATESLLLTTPTYGWQAIPVIGSKTTGNVLTITVFNALLTGGKESVSYTVLAADTLDLIATGLANAVNANSNLSGIGVSATATSSVVNMQSVAPMMSTYSTSKSGGATADLLVTAGYGIQSSNFNSVNELTNITGGGAAYFKGTTTKPIKSASISSQVINIQSPVVTEPLSVSASSSKSPTETLSIVEAPGTIFNASAYNFNFSGTPTAGDTVSVTFADVRFIPQGSRTISYTVQPGNTIGDVAYGFSQVLDNDPIVLSVGIHSRNYFGGTQVPVGIPTPNQGSGPGAPPPVGITSSVTSSGSEALTVGPASDENKNITVSGTATTGDVVSISIASSSLAGGSKTVSYTVPGSSTTNSIASALALAVNSDSSLQTAGISAYSSGSVVTIGNYTYYTTSVGSGTETLAISKPLRGSTLVTVGGTITAGDVLSIVAHNSKLSGGQTTVSYTVQATDTLQSIAQNLTASINGNVSLQTLAIVANDSAGVSNLSFFGLGNLSTGLNVTSVSATDGSGSTKANNYVVPTNGGTSSALTYDLNGNLTSDGTNTYLWDAENRLVNIAYPGSSNFSAFVHDGLGNNVSIVETTSGIVTSTQQFVWANNYRRESRDSLGNTISRYFSGGVTTSGASQFFTGNHLGSICEVTNSSALVTSEYSYDAYGRVLPIQEFAKPDFMYAGYFLHSRSKLNLTKLRAYNPEMGRFISRDIVGEAQGGLNLFTYVSNAPVKFVDPFGLQESGASSGGGPSSPPGAPGTGGVQGSVSEQLLQGGAAQGNFNLPDGRILPLNPENPVNAPNTGQFGPDPKIWCPPKKEPPKPPKALEGTPQRLPGTPFTPGSAPAAPAGSYTGPPIPDIPDWLKSF